MKRYLASRVCVHRCRADNGGELASKKELSGALNLFYLLCFMKLSTSVGEHAETYKRLFFIFFLSDLRSTAFGSREILFTKKNNK